MTSLCLHVVLMMLTVTVLTATPLRELDDLRSDELKQDIRQQLEQLKTKLRKLENEGGDIAISEKTMDTKPELTPKQKTQNEAVSMARTEKSLIEKFLRNLTPEGLEVLKDLRAIIRQGKTHENTGVASVAREHANTDTKEGTFLDHELSKTEEGVDVKVDGAAVVQTGSDTDWEPIGASPYHGRPVAENKPGDDMPVENEEGHLVDLRSKIKDAIEKNLLSDIALAVRSGIPVQEIIQDFQFSEDQKRQTSM